MLPAGNPCQGQLGRASSSGLVPSDLSKRLSYREPQRDGPERPREIPESSLLFQSEEMGSAGHAGYFNQNPGHVGLILIYLGPALTERRQSPEAYGS